MSTSEIDPEVFDFEYLKTYTSEDDDLQRDVMGLFFGQIESLLDRLDPLGTAQDWKSGAHAIKGSARGLGMVRIGNHCQAMEERKEEPEDTRRKDKAKLQSEIENARAAVIICYPGLFDQ